MEVNIRPRRSHSNSFGNDAEKDTAGYRALTRKYIVIGGKTKGAYVIENEFFEGELVSDYRRNKINYGEEKFAVLLYFGHHKKVILLQE